MPGQKGFLSAVADPLAQAMVDHANAPPVRKNQNRAIFGTWLLVAGGYLGHGVIAARNVDVGASAMQFAVHPITFSTELDWPVVAWGAVMLFALLLLAVGLRNARAPRDIMPIFWDLVWTGGFVAALYRGWYLDDRPAANFFLKGFYIASLAALLMSLFLSLRGPGRRASSLVEDQIERQSRPWRVGRRRQF